MSELESRATAAALRDYAYGTTPVERRLSDLTAVTEVTAIASARSAGRLVEISESAAVLPGIYDALVAHLPEMTAQLRSAAVALGSIEHLLANPEATAAREHVLRAEDLFSRNLWPEAEREYLAVLEHEPYDGVVYYRLGQLSVLANQEVAAAAHFESAQRYGTGRALVAGATLLAAAAHERAQREHERRQVVDIGLQRVDDCPEVWMVAARTSGVDALARALSLAPELSPQAAADRLPDIEEAAERALANDHRALGDTALQALQTARSLSALTRKAGGAAVPEFAVPERPSGSPSRELAWTVYVRGELERVVAPLREVCAGIPYPDQPHEPIAPTPQEETFGTPGRVVWTVVGIVLAVPTFGISLILLVLFWREMIKHDNRESEASAQYAKARSKYVGARASYESELELYGRVQAALRELTAQYEASAPRGTRTVPLFI